MEWAMKYVRLVTKIWFNDHPALHKGQIIIETLMSRKAGAISNGHSTFGSIWPEQLR